MDPEPRGPNPDGPQFCWSRRFDEPPPSRNIHKPSKPGFIEILGLLPVAVRARLLTLQKPTQLQECISHTHAYTELKARVGSYVSSERRAGREPIFDLSGIDLHPPDPGPVIALAIF